MIKPYEMLRPELFKAVVERAHFHGLRTGGHISAYMTIEEVLEIDPDYDILHLGGQCSGMKFDCTGNADQWRQKRVAALEAHRDKAKNGGDLLGRMEDDVPIEPPEADSTSRHRLIERFVEKGTWHTPTITCIANPKDLGFEHNPDRLDTFQYVPADLLQRCHAVTASPMMLGRYQWGLWYLETVGLLHKAGVPLLAGTDHPPFLDYTPGVALHFELAAFAKAGISPLAALQTATLNPARFFDIEGDFGSVSEGCYADLLLLDKDPLIDINNTRCIQAVVSRGQLFDRQRLDSLLEDMTEKRAEEA